MTEPKKAFTRDEMDFYWTQDTYTLEHVGEEKPEAGANWDYSNIDQYVFLEREKTIEGMVLGCAIPINTN